MTDGTACRYGVVGTGARAQMFVAALAGEFADVGELVAWCEPNPARMDHADRLVARHRPGAPSPARYGPADLERMVAEQGLSAVVVTSPDWTHAEMATRAMLAGADVVLEKPLATSIEGAGAIVEAVEHTGRSLVLTFNYRYAHGRARRRRAAAGRRLPRRDGRPARPPGRLPRRARYASAMAWLLVVIIGGLAAVTFLFAKYWVFYDD